MYTAVTHDIQVTVIPDYSPDRSEPEPSQRLPDADDVLAKWISLRAGERELISVANMHVPGRQVDPGQAGRDLIRLREWRARRVAAAA